MLQSAQYIMGKTLVKTILTAVAVFKGHNSECDLQQDIMLFHVNCLM